MKIEKFDNTEFGELKTIELDGDIWFVGKQVATLLLYSNTAKAILDFCEDAIPLNKFDTEQNVQLEEIKNDLNLKGNSAGQSMLITESDLYNLSFSSKLPKAKEFRKWVTKTILPSLRKHGGYIVGQEHLSQESFDNMTDEIGLLKNMIDNLRSDFLELKGQVSTMYATVKVANDGRTCIAIEDYCDFVNNHIKDSGFSVGRNVVFKILREKLNLIRYKNRGGTQQIVSSGRKLLDGTYHNEFVLDRQEFKTAPSKIHLTQRGINELTTEIIHFAVLTPEFSSSEYRDLESTLQHMLRSFHLQLVTSSDVIPKATVPLVEMKF